MKRSGNTSYSSILKAYDAIKRESLYDVLIKFSLPKKRVRFIKACCVDGTRVKVRIVTVLSSSFPNCQQFDTVLPILFNFAPEQLAVGTGYKCTH